MFVSRHQRNQLHKGYNIYVSNVDANLRIRKILKVFRKFGYILAVISPARTPWHQAIICYKFESDAKTAIQETNNTRPFGDKEIRVYWAGFITAFEAPQYSGHERLDVSVIPVAVSLRLSVLAEFHYHRLVVKFADPTVNKWVLVEAFHQVGALNNVVVLKIADGRFLGLVEFVANEELGDPYVAACILRSFNKLHTKANSWFIGRLKTLLISSDDD